MTLSLRICYTLRTETLRVVYIPVLMASTGSSREAEIAGIAPDINPIKDESPNPKKIFPKDKTNEKSSSVALTTIEINQTKITPIKPPNNDKIIASNKN